MSAKRRKASINRGSSAIINDAGAPPANKAKLKALIVSSVVTVLEYRHGSHVILGPFEHAPDLYSGLNTVWALSEDAFTGWVFWSGTLVSSSGVMLASAYGWSRSLLGGRNRRGEVAGQDKGPGARHS